MSTILMTILTTVTAVFMVVILPVWLLLHYLTKMKSLQGLSDEDEESLVKMWQTTQAMQERIHTLETILDDKHPTWRDNDE
jgi:phage shock protein B